MYEKDAHFREVINSRAFVYADGHICLNQSQYVGNTKKGYLMTKWALGHVDQCCMKFSRTYHISADHYRVGELHYDDEYNECYSGSSEQDLERGCVGHLRGDFGKSGGEFWTSWFDHQPELKSPAFHEEFQNVVKSLRKQDGLLRNFASMSRGCRDGLSCDDSFGFKAESPHYTYCLRCTPRRGDYNFYLYAYDKDAQREQALLKGQKEHDKQPTAKPEIKRNEMER